MPFRTTPADVKGIIDFDPSVQNLSPFIEAANQLVTEICAPAGYNADRLRIIETWLAAHFVAIRDPRYVAENMGAAGASYQQKVGFNLQLTSYGQQVMVLDTAGGLANLNNSIAAGIRPKIGITWLGSTPLERRVRFPWLFYNL